jgi:hypothetical protein
LVDTSNGGLVAVFDPLVAVFDVLVAVARSCDQRPWLDIDVSNVRGHGTSTRYWNSLLSDLKKRGSQIPVVV